MRSARAHLPKPRNTMCGWRPSGMAGIIALRREAGRDVAGRSSECAGEDLRHSLLSVQLQRREERQRERPGARILGDRTEALREAVALAHVLLQVDRGQVAVVADARAFEVRDHALARL